VSEAVFRDHFEQIWNNKDDSGIERFIAPNYRGFDPAEPEPILGVEGYRRHFVTITTGFPDMRINIEDILEKGDRVVARWHVEATHTGNFGDLPPTGIAIKFLGISVARIPSLQLVEEHGISDTLGVLRQLGVISETGKIPSLFL
jgi:predicted ester cyclase